MFGHSSLAPVQPPFSLIPGYTRNAETVLVMKEKVMSLSGDDFSVKDSNGQTLLKVGGRSMSMRDRKVFKDPNGQVLFELRDKKIALKRTFVGEAEDGTDLFTVSKNFISMHKTLTVKLAKEERKLEVKSDMVWKNAKVELGGDTVAEIHRDIRGREVADKQTYSVTVAPGMDIALAAALAVCFDELAEDEEE